MRIYINPIIKKLLDKFKTKDKCLLKNVYMIKKTIVINPNIFISKSFLKIIFFYLMIPLIEKKYYNLKIILRKL